MFQFPRNQKQNGHKADKLTTGIHQLLPPIRLYDIVKSYSSTQEFQGSNLTNVSAKTAEMVMDEQL